VGAKNRNGGGEKRGLDEGVEDVDVWFPFLVGFVVDFSEGVDFCLEFGGDEDCEGCLC